MFILHCGKIFHLRSFFWSVVNLRIQSKYGKIRTRKLRIWTLVMQCLLLNVKLFSKESSRFKHGTQYYILVIRREIAKWITKWYTRWINWCTNLLICMNKEIMNAFKQLLLSHHKMIIKRVLCPSFFKQTRCFKARQPDKSRENY